MTTQETPVPRFDIGQRVRVRRRVTGRQLHAAGQVARVMEYEPTRARGGNGGWYLVDTLPCPMWYAREQLEAIE